MRVFWTSLLACACASTPPPPAANPVGPPAWFNKPPTALRALYFTGDATDAPNEGMARDLAIQKAMANLTQYCGAVVKSDFSSNEVYIDGKTAQTISLTVDISGDELTIREATVKEVSVGPQGNGSYAAYALIEWPKAQYEEVLTAQRSRGERALTLYMEAETAANDNRYPLADEKLKAAKVTLGPAKGKTALGHPQLRDTGLLWDAIETLDRRLVDALKERNKVVAVAVACHEKGSAVTCASRWTGKVGEKAAAKGYRVAADPVPDPLLKEILSSASPQTTATVRSARYVLAVKYDATLKSVEDGFTYVLCGARGVVYDTDSHRIVSVTEVKPEKVGHVNFEGARDKGCARAEENVVQWIDQALGQLK